MKRALNAAIAAASSDSRSARGDPRPSQRPRRATDSAILRVASSIISPSKRTAPRPSPSVAWRYAARMPSARAYVAGSGV